MNILYLSNQRLPTEKAYGRQISKMCSSFSVIPGVELELAYPSRDNNISEDFFAYYGIPNNFKVTCIRTPDFYWFGKFESAGFLIKNLISAILLVKKVLHKESDIVYSRDDLPLYLLSFFKNNLVYEAHKIQKRRAFMYRRFKNKRVRVITINKILKEEFIKLGFNPENIFVAPDCVDKEAIDKESNSPMSVDMARKKLNLPHDKKIAVYTGSLYRWKGVYTLADAAKLMPDILFVVVGGDERGDELDFNNYIRNNHIENIKITGYIKSEETIRTYLSAADILILPNSAKDPVSQKYTSPLKLFEYMAARRPIVASDLPSLREILNENNSILVKPDDAGSMADGIKKILNDNILAGKISQSVFEAVKKYTWQNRADNILNFIK